MSYIKIEIWDTTGNRKVPVEVPGDVSVDRLSIVLIEKLSLPKFNPTGQFMSYKLHHRRLGVQLLDDKTLIEQAVEEGDVLRIIPEITAG